MPNPIPATRLTYHAYCREPDITHAEWCAVSEARALARSDARFRAYLDRATVAERAAEAALPPVAECTWRDIAEVADVYTRLVQAQVGAWKEYNDHQVGA